jgi:transcription elongation factor Elf1
MTYRCPICGRDSVVCTLDCEDQALSDTALTAAVRAIELRCDNQSCDWSGPAGGLEFVRRQVGLWVS